MLVDHTDMIEQNGHLQDKTDLCYILFVSHCHYKTTIFRKIFYLNTSILYKSFLRELPYLRFHILYETFQSLVKLHGEVKHILLIVTSFDQKL